MDLPGTATDDPSLPLGLSAIRLPHVDSNNSAAQGAAQSSSGLTHLVEPPVDPATGHRPTVCVLAR
jgi:hypothetical protein